MGLTDCCWSGGVGVTVASPLPLDRLDSNQLSVTCSFVARCGRLPLAKEYRLLTARSPGWSQWGSV